MPVITLPQLRARGYRMTPQRHGDPACVTSLRETPFPHRSLSSRRARMPGLTETTVYRTLEFLAENGLARPAHMGNGHLVYEIARHEAPPFEMPQLWE